MAQLKLIVSEKVDIRFLMEGVGPISDNDVLLAAQPTKRFVTPEEVAALALFLCRDEAASITGANLSMDGGWTAA